VTASVLFVASDGWRTAFHGAIAAALTLRGVVNPETTDALDAAKRALEDELRRRWNGKSRADLRADPILAVYDRYDKAFGQTYHVQMQIESIALKNKAIPSRAALVEAMFMAELASGLLTAVHDLDAIRGPVEVIRTDGSEEYTRYDGVVERCKPGDMAMRDRIDILTSVIQGPTTHARATAETRSALFCVYAPGGIEETTVRAHLDTLERFVALAAPESRAEERILVKA
jgi:DNA/RNA-binding domain of Phe-tRNA-synthetase-like protein